MILNIIQSGAIEMFNFNHSEYLMELGNKFQILFPQGRCKKLLTFSDIEIMKAQKEFMMKHLGCETVPYNSKRSKDIIGFFTTDTPYELLKRCSKGIYFYHWACDNENLGHNVSVNKFSHGVHVIPRILSGGGKEAIREAEVIIKIYEKM